ncbi:MAG: alpha-L-fucosidase [Armatimonadetes bacterium]|nr:alpha-L-fucosidase [Armatimonadota bacterium]
MPGPFKPTMDSLKRYEYPDWFRDAKFGIWAHWGPQSVPMDGDWYARGMYEQGSGHNKYHLAHYGHPSTFGYKDIIPLWKAEKWDPARLMKLYKKAGAKYFVSMGSHHDNFFLWNSKLHAWNSVQMGPKKDVVGIWQREARKNGLKFGVSEHLGASFTWFQASHSADKTGPKAGIPYDGADPQFADLYHVKAEPGDTAWYSNNPKWQRKWYASIKELIDNYHPDLLYSDGAVPFGNEVGLSMIAHFYNTVPNGVYNCKQKSEGRWVEDLERGNMAKIDPHPWQTDTSIGDWFYNRNWKYRPINWVVSMLVDNVSKNGNLLLNVVQRPDGSIDPDVETMLEQMADWIKIHGEAIYGSRPWLVYGEGAPRARGGSFNEDFGYTAKDIRFTTQGPTIYAISLAYPGNDELLVRSLGKTDDPSQNKITSVSLLGYKGKLEWSQSRAGLLVKLPAKRVSNITAGLKIKGKNLKPVPIPIVVQKVEADAKGVLNLAPGLAELHGETIHEEAKDGIPNLGFWFDAKDWASWTVTVPAAGTYRVSASIASLSDGSELAVRAGSQTVVGIAPNTGDWARFKTIELGTFKFDKPGDVVVSVRPKDAATWKAINLRSVVLTPAKEMGR